ncbi:MAG: acylneuraminate cytidylyltransferase family protein [Bacteroidales bacterium]|nr:acylneuraminate cytidylyltransferase family protein [Bacteroidales bacterium]
MKPLIIIPARSGSKGIPGKNIKPLAGKPLIAYSIDTAHEICRRRGLQPSHILVSTDSEEIASVAETYGAPTIYRRPPELATDTAGSREMMLHAAEWAQSQGVDFDYILLLQPTSPLRTADDTEQCMRLYESELPDMAVTVREASANPYYNCFETAPDGSLQISKGDGMLTRRQDAPHAWEFNGAVYAINPKSLAAMPMGRFPRRIPSEMPPERSIDLDTPLDWEIAEVVIRSINPQN